MTDHEYLEEEYSFKNYFVPLTTLKAIHWIIIIGLVVFFNILFNGFVFDDGLQVENNVVIHSIANIPYFFTGGNFVNTSTDQLVGIYYRPVLTSIYAIIYTFLGSSAFPFHLVQLLLHITNAVLVFLLLRKFFAKSLTFFLTLLFLVHPINQETVAYISNLQDILFFFFGIIAFLLGTSKHQGSIKLSLLCIFLLLALLSKETAILFIPVIILYEYLFQRKRFSYKFLLSIFATTVLYLFLRFFVAHLSPVKDPFIPIMNASLQERLITMPSMIFYYLKTFFFPYKLALGHDWIVTSLTFNQFYMPFIVDIVFFFLLGFLGFFIWKTHRKSFATFMFFFTWFVLGLLMHLQFIPLDATVADRWFYFPIVGLIGVIGIVSTVVSPYLKVYKSFAIYLAVAIITLLAVRTFVRNSNWINAPTLCQHDLQIVYDSYPMQFACAGDWLQAGDVKEAQKHFAIVAQLAPDWGENWYLYGVSMAYAGDNNAAQKYYLKDLDLTNDSNAYIALGSSYLKDNNIPEAKMFIQKGLQHYKNYPKLLLFLAVVEYDQKDKGEALITANKAYHLLPSLEALYVITQITNNKKVKIN